MSRKRNSLQSMALKCAGVLAITMLAVARPAVAQVPAGTAFTYQGELSEGGTPVDATCDFEFSLWDDAVGGLLIGVPLTQTIDVAGGRLTTILDFGVGIFSGDATWLEIAVCCPSVCAPATLTTRQELTPAPYALFALGGNEGPEGPEGPQGLQGIPGPQGDPGDSHWLLNGSATYYNAGNVGIGTNNPTHDLDILQSTAAFVRAKSTGGRAGYIIDRASATENGYVIYRTNGSEQWFVGEIGAGGADSNYAISTSFGSPDGKFYLRTDGNLGIGTTNPAGSLHVRRPDSDVARIYATGTNQGAGMVYVGQGTTFGGGIAYDGDGIPNIVGESDRVTYFRRNAGVDMDVFSYAYNSSNVAFNGNVGIGTTSPSATLDVVGTVNNDALVRLTNNGGAGAKVLAISSGSTGTADIVDIQNGAFVVQGNGRVGIGTTSPAEKLHVCGNIRAVGNITASGSITASVSGACPDYVFEPDYELMPLDELSEYILRNKHLPNVPPAEVVERDGIDLGGFSMRLLEKTEELTLYVLAQDKRLNEKDAEIESLRAQNAALGIRLGRIEEILARGEGGVR